GHDDAFGFRLDEQTARAVPRRASVVTYVLLVLMLAANASWGSIGKLLALSSLSVTLQYLVTAASLFALARRRSAGRSPRAGWPAPLAIASCVLLMFGSSELEIPVVAATIALGFVLRALSSSSIRSSR